MIQDAVDFFISYNKADRSWAEWIAWQLEAEGYTTIIQDWDFQIGTNFILNMQQATSSAKRTLVVLSPDYLASLFTQPEWAAAFVRDPTGRSGTLLPVRVRPCKLSGMLAAIVYLNLVNLDEPKAKSALLTGVRGTRGKPAIAPLFPGRAPNIREPAPRFPGSAEAPAHTISAGTSRGINSYVHRIFIVLLVMLILFSAMSGIYLWRAHSSQTDTGVTCGTNSPTQIVNTIPSMSPYDTYVSQHGIMFGFDAQHSRVNPYERTLNAGNVSGLKPKWTFLTCNKIDSSAPAVAGGVVYVGSQDGNLYAIDAATGEKKWSYSIGKAINSSPAVVNGIVYVGSDDGNLYAIDAATGEKKWSFSTGDVINSSPAVANGVVYISSQDNYFYAIDARTGQQKWKVLTGAIHDSSPAVAKDMVYVGSWKAHKLYAFNKTTGNQSWAKSMGDAIHASPVVANGVVYIGSDGGKFYAFDASSGAEKWIFSADDSFVCSPTIANGMVYVGSWDHKLYAFWLS